LVGVVNYPNWLTFARESNLVNDFPKVVIYINIRLFSLHFSLQKDIINHKDILLVLFFNNNKIFWLMNVYSDSSYSALKYLKDIEVNIHNLSIITSDFNIHDSHWDPFFPYHSTISDDLIIITDSFNLDLSISTNQVLTRYLDNVNDSNLVIDLMFLQNRSNKLNNYSIHPNWHLTLDHAPLTIIIPIIEESVISSKHSIIINSKEEAAFIKNTTISIKNLDISDLSDTSRLEFVVNEPASKVKSAWKKNSKTINITRYSKSWWNKDCSRNLRNYRSSKNLEDWKIFWKTVKNTKQAFFDLNIQEIANKKRDPWELMNWVNK